MENQLRDGVKFYDTLPSGKLRERAARLAPYGNYIGGRAQCITSRTAAGKYTAYWERRLFMAFQFALPLHLPKEWDYATVVNIGAADGFVGVTKVNSLGVHAVRCSLQNYDLYYRPEKIHLCNTKANQLNGSAKKYEVGKNCELLRFTGDWQGIGDTIRYYAEQLSKATSVLNCNLVGNRLVYAIAAKSQKSAETIKAMMQEVENEDPAIVYDVKLYDDDGGVPNGNPQPWQSLFADLGKTWIAPSAQETLEKIWLSALRALGIPTPYEKAEHTIGSENDMLNCAAGTLMDVVCDSLEESIGRIKKLYPDLDISINRRELKYNVDSEPTGNDGNVSESDKGVQTT